MPIKGNVAVAAQLASARAATVLWKVELTPILPCQITYSKQKYTVQSVGLWEYIRRALAVDPNRSNGVPMNLHYRNPPPGAITSEAYEDPVTDPAGDIADNAYHKRDTRRNYPRMSVFKQADIVRLLSFGSKANPRSSSLRIGDAGAKPLVQIEQAGEAKGISAFLERDSKSSASILGTDGLPPFPTGQGRLTPNGGKMYLMNVGRTEGYPGEYVLHYPLGEDVLLTPARYPCRTFF